MVHRIATLGLVASCLALGLAAANARAKDQPKRPKLANQFVGSRMCNDCGGWVEIPERECSGAKKRCCRKKLYACWAWCDGGKDGTGGAGCNLDADCMRGCRAECSNNARFCNGGRDPTAAPGSNERTAPPAGPVAPTPPERDPRKGPVQPSSPGLQEAAPSATPEDAPSTPRQPTAEKTPSRPGYIWVDDHWERARKKK
jgi:hypothetical protein